MEKPNFWHRPVGLSVDGNRAYDVIMKFVTDLYGERGLDDIYTGSSVFVAPKLWTGQYGRESELVVVYECADFAYLFSMDAAYETACMVADAGLKMKESCYAKLEALQEALRLSGMFFEEATRSYGAVYRI